MDVVRQEQVVGNGQKIAGSIDAKIDLVHFVGSGGLSLSKSSKVKRVSLFANTLQSCRMNVTHQISVIRWQELMPRSQRLETEKEKVLDRVAAFADAGVVVARCLDIRPAEADHHVLAAQAILGKLKERHKSLLEKNSE